MRKGVNYEMISQISKNLSSLYRDGINFLLGLQLILELPLSRSYKVSIKECIASVKEGNTLSSSLEDRETLYPEFFIKMLKIGEETGHISEVLDGLSKYYLSKYNYKKTIILNSIYPMILVSAILGFIMMFIYLIVPSFSEMLLGNENLPYLTEKIINISVLLNKNKIMGIFIIIIWGIIIPIIIYKAKGKSIKIYLKNHLKFLNSKKEYETLILINLCLEGGLNITRGLEIFLETENKENIIEIEKIRDSLLKGLTISESISKSIKLSGYSKAMINLGEESGSLEEKLKLVVKALEEKNNNKIKVLTNLIQPIFTIFIAIIILIFIGLFFFPLIDSIYSGIN